MNQPPAFEPSLPTTPTSYASFWRTPRWRWWRPVVALALGVVAMFVLALVRSAGAIAFDISRGRLTTQDLANLGLDQLTASVFLANNLSLAALILVAFFISAVIFKQRPGFLASVTGSLRWGWLGRCVLIVLPLWLIYIGFDWFLTAEAGGFDDLAVNQDTWLLVVGILITTPLQSAGEEYGFRGVVNRAIAGFFRNEKAGLVAGLIVSSGVFMWAHSASDLWLNLYYFSFGAASCILVWRTGGLEASIVMHVVNNLLSEAFLPFSDISGLFDRSSGAGGPDVLIGMAVIAVAPALIIWQARRRGIAITAAPAASMQAPAAPMSYPPPAPNPYLAPGSTPEPGWGTYPGVPQPRWPQDVPPQTAPIEQDPLFNPRPWESGDRP
ncbi:hypothetical protein SDC9_99353 [bioreactor metagenome]|uniref:CAAX prenyl protease 2/Lysostaphin resistance protein A-like domain-containing protein n=1 Tax=bioreactor metagenome TaxID=1076179 RepID=A0A645AP19_9ZZZZ